ncbi:MAG: phosphatase PAP2 family protein [Anaerolineales bacterium]|nr:phosphatase PAP2 family protein [Anaerolineales bacterium]
MKRWMEWDARLSEKLRIGENSVWLKRAAAFFAHSGDSWFWLFGLLLVGVLVPSMRQVAILYASSILILAIMVLGIKFSVKRQRPQGEWGAIYRRTDPHSFPSGHAARAILLAVLGMGFGPPLWGVGLAIWAPLVSLSRVALGLHYLSDILAGAALGAFVGLLCLGVFA